MPIQILMPALSPTMTEGNLARWLKKEGDTVKAGQVLAEIETDKATMEVEAVDEGKIVKILIQGGAQGVKVNTPIAILAEEGEENLSADALIAKLQSKGATTPTSHAREGGHPSTVSSGGNMPEQAQVKMDTAGASPRAGGGGHDAPQGNRVFASPLAKRIAEQKGINLSSLRGTGPGGRIIKIDVENARSSGSTARSVATAPAQGVDARDYADKLGMAYDAQPNSTVRKVIAKRLLESKQTVPHFYLTVDCEIDALLDLRKQINETGAKVSVNDCVIRAVALALKKVPAANASWTDDAILLYQNVDVSVAVATPGGLVTPIIRNADTKTLTQISAEMKDLGVRAREGKLKPTEFMGGGFSISNLGMFGVKEFSAIINPPQSCILAVGAGEQRAVVKNGQLAVATVMTVTLSVDHRSVDGTVGAEFLQAFKPLIEKPYGLVV
jgi:pyruvate dehydrogenase E2 component (dihydrolipoamide acetyltransferase)